MVGERYRRQLEHFHACVTGAAMSHPARAGAADIALLIAARTGARRGAGRMSRRAIVTGSDSASAARPPSPSRAAGYDVGITWHTDEAGARETRGGPRGRRARVAGST